MYLHSTIINDLEPTVCLKKLLVAINLNYNVCSNLFANNASCFLSPNSSLTKLFVQKLLPISVNGLRPVKTDLVKYDYFIYKIKNLQQLGSLLMRIYSVPTLAMLNATGRISIVASAQICKNNPAILCHTAEQLDKSFL